MARILVIRGGAIGDFILTLPTLRLLRENFPEAHVEILGYRHIVALAEGRFYAQAARSIEYGSLARFFIPKAELNEAWVSYFASFHQVISYLFDPDRFFENNLRRAGVKNFLAGSPKIVGQVHATRQLAEPLQSLALYLDDEVPRVFPSAQDEQAAALFLENAAHPRVMIHPSSGSERKNWPLESWALLGHALAKEYPTAEILLVGGEADEMRITQLQWEWRTLRVRPVLHQPLPVLAAILARGDLFLGHDSGISHLAAAVEAPCVLLFGPTDPQVWAPRNPQVRILKAGHGGLEKMSVEQVLAAAREILLING